MTSLQQTTESLYSFVNFILTHIYLSNCSLHHSTNHFLLRITSSQNSFICMLSILPWSLQKVIVVVQSPSCVQLFVTPWTAAHQASLSFTLSWSLLKFMSIELVMPSDHLILCHPFSFLPSIYPSIRVFSNESALCIRWPMQWSFSISPSNEYSGLIFFRIDWLDLLAVQGTLKSLL